MEAGALIKMIRLKKMKYVLDKPISRNVSLWSSYGLFFRK